MMKIKLYVGIVLPLLLCFMLPGLTSADNFELECHGGNLSSENSTFMSPNFTNPYGSNIVNCTWTAHIPGGMFLIFDQFFLDGLGDSIIVEDEDGFIGQYFGIQQQFIIQTLSDELTITFNSGNDPSSNLLRKFSGQVKKDCKLQFTAQTFGYISTPLIRTQNVSQVFSCTWLITNLVTQGSVLSFQTSNFTDTNALLQVYGGFSNKQPLLGNFSADSPAHAVVTDTNQMFINLTYDISLLPTMSGLYKRTSAECTSNVNLTANDEPTNITSIGYPTQYRNDMQCWWLFETDPMSSIVVVVTNVDLHDEEDTLVFYSSASRYSERLATLGGKQLEIPVLVTNSNMMLVSFSSNDMGVYGGFSFEIFSQDIGGVVTPTADDTINITLHSNKHIFQLVQTEQNFQPVVTQAPQIDFPTTGNLTIVFYQDSYINRNPLITQTVADGIIPLIFSNTQTMLIYAEGFDEYVNGSLTMQVTAVPSGTNLYSTNKNGDSFSGKPMDNYWIINPDLQGSTTPNSSMIEVTFQDLPVSGGPMVTIDRGLSVNQTQSIASLNARNDFSLCLPIGDPVKIHFVSETEPVPIYSNYHLIEGCDEQVDSSEGFGSITSRHFPSSYPLNARCVQTLIATSSKEKLHLKFTTFSMAANHSVRIEEVAKGGFNATYMAGDLPNDIVLNTSNVSVTLNSEMTLPIKNITTDQGFEIDFTVLDCGGNLTARTGNMSTPGYPKLTSASTTCVWIVTVPLKASNSSLPSIVVLKANTNQLKNQTMSNYVKFYDGPNERSPLVTSDQMSTFKSTGRSMVIKYVNENKKGFSFQFSYSTYDCGANEVCGNGKCLHDSWRCDGVDQCGDNSDEQNCNGGLVSKKTLGLSVFGGVIITIVVIVVAMFVLFKYKQRTSNYKHLDEAINT